MNERIRHRSPTEGIVSNYRRRDIILLLAGFLALVAAVVAAYRSPASGYELSIYAATPLAFWAGIAVAMACALIVGFSQSGRASRLAAYLLAGESFLAVVGLPILRGYEYFTAGDALSHMGWVRDILSGEITSVDLIYPGTHVISIYVHRLLGLSLEQSMQFIVVVFAAVFFVFVPLVVYVLTDSITAMTVGVFSAVMVIPINNISVHLAVFPSTIAIFFVPFVVLIAAIVLKQPGGAWGTPVDVLVGLGSVAIVLLHPQQAVNLVLVLGTVSITVLAYRYWSGIQTFDPLVGHTAFLTVLVAGWSLSHARIVVIATAYTEAVVGVLTGNVPTSGGAIARRSASLSALGVSRAEIGLKLFLPALVFAVLTGLLLAHTFLSSARRDDERLPVAILGLGLVPVGTVMVLYIAGQLQTIYFRHFGFIMALATIFGAIGLARGMEALSTGNLRRSGVAFGTLLLAALLTLSVLTVFPSPFIHQPNAQVTEMQMSGHETAFAHENGEIEYVGIRAGTNRFRDGIEGTEPLQIGDRASRRVPFGSLDQDLTTIFDGPRYLTVSRVDVQRESVVWRNVRYSDRGFRTIDDRNGVERVVTNGDFTLYYIRE